MGYSWGMLNSWYHENPLVFLLNGKDSWPHENFFLFHGIFRTHENMHCDIFTTHENNSMAFSVPLQILFEVVIYI